MDRPEPPARVPVSAEWLAEQERKQAAYAAARRLQAARWEGRQQAEAEPEEAPPPSPVPSALELQTPSKGQRPRGMIIDQRQDRLF